MKHSSRSKQCGAAPLRLFYCCCVSLLCQYTLSLCIHSMRVRILIFEMTLITKKEGGKNCASWPKAIKGTLISLAIMLWGILNSVISACYIWRKVSGNCFVLLEQKKKEKLLKWAHVALSTTWWFASRPSARSPRALLLVPTPDSQKFSHKRWLVWRNKCHGDKKRLWHQPLDDLVATYCIKKQSLSVRTTDLCGLLVCEHHLSLVARLLRVSIW